MQIECNVCIMQARSYACINAGKHAGMYESQNVNKEPALVSFLATTHITVTVSLLLVVLESQLQLKLIQVSPSLFMMKARR